MTVKEFLSVCDFMVDRIIDFSGNVYFLSGVSYAHYEDMKISKVIKSNDYITIMLDTFGYDGEYQQVRYMS